MLSVIILTKNEEKNIKYCLESIKSLADEIIIVDSYSSDKTVEIAKKYTNKIFLKKFENDFAAQRNYALNKTRGDWILSIDADERLSKSLQGVIPNLIKNTKYLGYLIPRRNYINNKTWLKYGLFYPDYQLRLFRKNGVKFFNRIHEYPNVREERISKIKQYIIHNPSRTKYNRFISIRKLFNLSDNRIDIESEDLLRKNKSSFYYLKNGLYEPVKYFIDGFILGKGFLEGWTGFRAAVIFSLYRLIIAVNVIHMKFQKKEIIITNNKFKYQLLDTHMFGVHNIAYNLIEKNKEILDIGCATGYLARKLKEKKCRTWGVDIDAEALKKAKKYCEKVTKIDANDLSKLDLNIKFDYILVLDIIEHLTNPQGCLKELPKYLKPEGKIIISTPNVAHISVRLKLLCGKFDYEKMGILDETHIKFFTRKSFIQILREANLKIGKVEYSVDFGQIPLVGRVLDLIPSDIQRFFTNWFNTLLAVQFIAVCKISPHYLHKE